MENKEDNKSELDKGKLLNFINNRINMPVNDSFDRGYQRAFQIIQEKIVDGNFDKKPKCSECGNELESTLDDCDYCSSDDSERIPWD